jgi:alpha-glucosidase
MSDELRWWQRAVIYQILVQSFADESGDGRGDLPGILPHLDYLQWLGIDAIWLSPINPSPWFDSGYDVIDYFNVHPAFGTLEDFDRLMDEAHRRDIRVLLDWVPNHTSHLHPWFLESRAWPTRARRDWYIWADPAPDGSPPNNWLSVFGGSAWTLDEGSGQYYFHAFLPEQPDLNWRNREVRRALLDSMRFWLDRGVDGFRIDAIDMLVEDYYLQDNPPNPEFDPERDAPDRAVDQKHTRDHPRTHEYVAMMRAVVEEYDDRVLIGEMYLPPEQVVTYYGSPGRPELHLPLNLRLLWADWDADGVLSMIEAYHALLPEHGWPTWSLGNHDRSRITTRAAGDQARIAAMLLFTLRGTPTLYYGDEIGMKDVPVPPEQMVDPQGKLDPARSRDVARTPMQWNAQPNAGFSRRRPWLPVARDYQKVNVERQGEDPRSMLTLHRRLIELRRTEPALLVGAQSAIERKAPVVGFLRCAESKRFLILLNLWAEGFDFDFGDHAEHAHIVLSTRLDRDHVPARGSVRLRGNEGLILELS